MTIESTVDGVVVRDGDVIVMSAVPSPVKVEVPIDTDRLAAVFRRGASPAPPREAHAAPTCFVCGIDGDLGVHPTRLPDSRLWATVWTPESLDAERTVRSEMVWAVLDCPGGWATGDSKRHQGSFFPALATMVAEIVHPVPVRHPVAVVGWMVSEDERRIDSGSALIDSDGTVLARAVLSQAIVPLDWGADAT